MPEKLESGTNSAEALSNWTAVHGQRQMLRNLASLARRRATCFVALVYLAGVVMPSVALAFADGAVTAYCFEDIAVPVTAMHAHVHVHSDGTVHQHVDEKSPATPQGESQKGQGRTGTQGHSHDANCCGLFGFTAVLPILSGATDEPAAFHIQRPLPADCLVGCGPDRIDRPPITLLPM